MRIGAEHPGTPAGNRPRIALLPTTNLGRWGVGLAAAFFALVFAGAVVPRGIALGIVCGLAGGVAALVSIVRDRERALSVFAAVLPLAIAVAFVLAQLISGNP